MTKSSLTLASGHEMPLAIKADYRLFDGAYDYQNEKEAGQGIQRAIREGLVKREDIFITTKLWNNYHQREHALAMAKAQNEAWDLSYIDLFLIHFPCALKYFDPAVRRYPAWGMDDAGTVTPDKVPIRETWESMEQLVDSGIARSIGVSNFQAQMLYDIMSYAKHPISSLQIEHHPYLVQSELIQMAQENGIAVTAYSSFGPQSFLELPATFSKKAKEIPLLLDAETIKRLADKYGATPTQVLLRRATQRNIAVIPKSNNPTRVQKNLDVLGFDISVEELESISSLDRGLRFNDPRFYLPNHPLHIFA